MDRHRHPWPKLTVDSENRIVFAKLPRVGNLALTVPYAWARVPWPYAVDTKDDPFRIPYPPSPFPLMPYRILPSQSSLSTSPLYILAFHLPTLIYVHLFPLSLQLPPLNLPFLLSVLPNSKSFFIILIYWLFIYYFIFLHFFLYLYPSIYLYLHFYFYFTSTLSLFHLYFYL